MFFPKKLRLKYVDEYIQLIFIARLYLAFIWERERLCRLFVLLKCRMWVELEVSLGFGRYYVCSQITAGDVCVDWMEYMCTERYNNTYSSCPPCLFTFDKVMPQFSPKSSPFVCSHLPRSLFSHLWWDSVHPSFNLTSDRMMTTTHLASLKLFYLYEKILYTPC